MVETIGTGTVLGVFLGLMLLALEIGRRIGRRRLLADPAGAHSGLGALEGAVFGLMGLLMAFTFSGSAARFDARRDLLLREANAIGTAWLRLDLLPPAAHDELRADLRAYVDLRLAATRARATQADVTLTALQQHLWSRAVAATLDARDARVGQLLLPAINDMFDIASARYLASQTHPPGVIYAMLLALALACALLAGHGMAGSQRPSWLHIFVFTGSLFMAIYVITDIEFPRRGFIRVDRYDQLLVDLRENMR